MKHWIAFGWIFIIIVFFIVAYSISNDPYSQILRDSEFFGQDNASITIVEFGDYLDPVSRESENSMKRLRMDYNIKFIYKHFVHSNQSMIAAMGSKCAQNQNLFEEMHNKLFAFDGEFTLNATRSMADEINGLKIGEFNQCMNVELFKLNIEKDTSLGKRLEVLYLPVVFINEVRFEGINNYDIYSDFVEKELNS
jgi:protein-disulfide isomerase